MLEYLRQAFSLLLGGDRELWQIIGVTVRMSFFSTLISSVIGLPLGVALGRAKFRGKGIFLRITNTLMGLPPVVAGLIVFLLLSRRGPLGSLQLLFSVRAMVIAQILLITPIITGLSASVSSVKAKSLCETADGIGISKFRQVFLLLTECKSPLISVILTGFGRAISEVGAVQIVGGNVQWKTRVMTTAIMLETNKGNFEFAIALGIILLILAFVVNSFAYRLQEKLK